MFTSNGGRMSKEKIIPKTPEEAQEQYYWGKGYALDDIGLAARLKALRQKNC